MVLKKAYFIDADYTIKNSQTYIRLILKGKKTTRLLYAYDPYFYVDTEKENIQHLLSISITRKTGESVKPKKAETCELYLNGEKKTFVKLYCHYPMDVPLVKKQIPFKCYEYRILFAKRFMLDMQLEPFSLLVYEREGRIIKKIISIKPGSPHLSYLSFDIETHNPVGAPRERKDPIIMISYSTSSGKEGVLTYKKINRAFVKTCKDEKDMIEQFAKIVEEEDPDILFGYNSSNFDLPYLKARAVVLNTKLAITRSRKGMIKTIKKGLITGMKITGRIHIDLYPMVRFFGFIGLIKSQKFTLENIYHEVTGDKKIMVQRDAIWEIWDSKDDKKIEQLSEYSLMDARATTAIGKRFLALEVELSTLTKMPLFDVALSTSGQLVENLLMFHSTSSKIVIPPRPDEYTIRERLRSPIQGAYVKLPEPGIYDRIAVLDFRGLYPSIIISYNIDPYSISEDGNHTYTSPTGAKFLKKPLGLIPRTLKELVDLRSSVKNSLKKLSKSDDEYSRLAARSHALKILNNSFFGYLGYPRSRWYKKACAESITAWGREHISETIKQAEKTGFKVLYGDSLHPERKIFIQDHNGIVNLLSISEFVDSHQKDPLLSRYKTLAFDGKKLVFAKINRAIRHYYGKEKGGLLEFITTRGKTITTPQHSVYAFLDGGLSLVDAKKLKSGNQLVSLTNTPSSEIVKEGQIFDITALDWGEYKKNIYLYQDNLRFPSKRNICPYCSKRVFLSSHVFTRHQSRKIPISYKIDQSFRFVGAKNAKTGRIPRCWKLTKELAWLLGYFAAEGSASERSSKHNKTMISFGSQDKKTIEKVKNILDTILQDNLKIIEDFDKRINKKMFYYRIQRIPLVALFVHGFGLGKQSSGKCVPSIILNSEQTLKKSFLEGYLEGDGVKYRDPRYRTHFQKFTTKSLDLAIGLSYLFKCLSHDTRTGFNKKIEHVHWIYRKDKPGIIDLRFQSVNGKEFENFSLAEIKQVNKLNYEGYVYDLEVDGAHNFVDAEGLILVHNTDSIFLLYADKPKVLEFLNEINKSLPELMELELEAFYTRGVFVSKKGGEERGAKKKYALLADDGTIKIRGFELVRRDWSAIAKETQLKVLEAILKEGSKEKAVDIVRQAIKNLQSGQVKLEDLAINTQLNKPMDKYAVKSPELSAALKGKAAGMHFEKGSIISFVITKKGSSVSEKSCPIELAKDYDPDYYINNQILPAVLKILKELGYGEYDLKVGGRQKGLGDFF